MRSEQRSCRVLSPTSARPAKAALPIVVGFLLLLFLTRSAFGEASEGATSPVTNAYESLPLEPPTQDVRAFPRVSLGGSRELEYLGTFCANAKYKKLSKFTRTLETQGSTSRSTSASREDAAKLTVAPSWMLLPAGRTVEDFEVPAHAMKIAQPRSSLASIRDALVTFAFGRASVMGTPQQLTTDSMLRVIISDPELRAVHIFDPKGKTTFSILGDQGRRLHLPAGVAVDAEDNIYIADSERGLVLVYNQYGQFIRYIGLFHGENMYERPAGIAIDRKARRLYLADTPRNLVFILDLEGNVLKRLGKDRHGNGSGEFASPTLIAVSDHGVVVLDAERSRIQILDFDGNSIGRYRIPAGVDRDNGLAVDNDGNIYISYAASSTISMYKPDGTSIGSFGQSGSRIGEFRVPRGLWVDTSNRIYVADGGNVRVQVFQVSTGAPSSH